MKKFQPKMTDGMGGEKNMSPEAHNEWKDEEGKHDAMAINGMGVKEHLTPEKPVGPDGFEPEGASKQGSLKGHEKKQIAKGYDSPSSQGLFKQAGGAGKSGFPKGPKKHAGKGAEGSTKGAGGAGKLNSGNGYSGPLKKMKY